MYQNPVRYFSIILSLIVTVSSIYLQNTRTDGKHSTQGRIFLPSGQNPYSLITVKLGSTSFGTISVTTN